MGKSDYCECLYCRGGFVNLAFFGLEESQAVVFTMLRNLIFLLLLGLAGFVSLPAQAQDTVCAQVKIQILQSLTLERQAFDATMNINNTTDTGVIQNVSVVVNVTDENGTPVAVTNDPNNLSASFFLKLSSVQSIAAVDGTGAVQPQTTATIDWQLIPAPGSAGSTPLGKKYLVGAKLSYRFNGVDTVLDVSPDVITVMPMPLLRLDYFLPQAVWGDDPLTPAIEAPVPFTLGVRVKNTGLADADNLQIDSAQPTIVDNVQGLLIHFTILDSYVNDATVQDTLNINFGNVLAGTSAMGRWIMETTLAGKFTAFTANFTHSNALGGALTSLFQGTATHFLIHDVLVDLPGRDTVRDFLAQDSDAIRVYESNSLDSQVTDHSGDAVLTAGADAAGTASYRLSFPAPAGFVYVKLPDPFNGQRVMGQVVRSDAKVLGAENVWLSKTRDPQTKQVQYWVNFFDVNGTGLYDVQFTVPPTAAQPPVIQFIPDSTTQEQQQVSFLVQASSPNGLPVTISAAPLPIGSTLTPQTANPNASGVATALFNWTPARNTAGDYLIVYTASDGTLSTSMSATIHVQPSSASIASPEAGNDSGTTRNSVNLILAVLANDSLAANSTVFNPATLDLDTSTPTVDATRTVSGEGTFTANPSGTVSFAPLPSFTGVSTITYNVKDNLGQASNAANLTVTVTGPGNPTGDTTTDGPVANPNTGSTLVNTPFILDIKSNDVAGPGQTLNLSTVDLDTTTNGVQPTQTTSAGTWKSNGDGTVTFTPAAGYSGLASLAYAIADSGGKTAQSTITIAVTGGATPLAQNDSGATQPSTPVNVAILDNDTPSAGQVLVPGSVDLNPTTPQLDGTITTAEGSWTANANGMLTFAPTSSYKATNQPFTGSTPPLPYTVADSSGQLAIASISIAVNPTAAPTATSVSANTAFNIPVNLNPASKSTASPGATLDPTTLDLNPATATVDQSISAAEGVWTVNADGTVGFAPASNYTGTTAAQPYLIRDSLGHSANAYLNVTVALPISVAVSGTVFQDINLDQIQDNGELGTNAGGMLYITAVNTGFAVATSAVAADGSYTLALAPDASYTLVLSDNPQGSTTSSLPTGWGNTGENNNGTPVGAIDGTLHISVGVATLGGQNFGITQGPQAANDSFSTAYGIPLSGTVAGNDTYPNGSVFAVMTGPSHGTATVNPDGSFTYVPATGFGGSDNFAYQLCLPSPNDALCNTATVAIDVGLGSQTISFGAAPTVSVGGMGMISATGGLSGNPVIFTSTTTGICTVTGSTVTGVTAGICTIAANQAGNANYYAASQVTQSFSVTNGPALTVSNTSSMFGNISSNVGGIACGTACSSNFAYGTVVTLTAIPNSGYQFAGWAGDCRGYGNTCTVTMSASQTVIANFAVFTIHQPVWKRLIGTITQGVGSQTISFGPTPAVSVGGTGTVSATGGPSGNPVIFTSTTTDICTVSGSKVTGLATGTCAIAADQAGNTNYSAAPQVMQTFAVGMGSQTISFGSAPTVSVGGIGMLSATGGVSGNPVIFTSTTTDVCAVSGSNVTGLAAGTCIIAANQVGNTNYNAAIQATQTITIGKGSQTLSFGAVPSVNVGGIGTLSAIGGASGNPVVFTSKTPAICTTSGANGNIITGVAVGTCIIAADQIGNLNYYPATEATQNLSVTVASFLLVVNNANYANGTVYSDIGGISCGTICTQNFPSGTTINLKAIPHDGFMFNGWGGACVGYGNACTVTLDAAKTVTANFVVYNYRKPIWKKLLPYLR